MSALGIIAGSRIVGLLGPYLVRWWWVIVALVWLSILWSAWAFVAPSRAARPVLAGAAVAIVALSLVGVRDGATGDVPLARESAAVSALTPDIEHALDPDRTYLLNWAETRTWSSVAVGVYLAAARRRVRREGPTDVRARRGEAGARPSTTKSTRR